METWLNLPDYIEQAKKLYGKLFGFTWKALLLCWVLFIIAAIFYDMIEIMIMNRPIWLIVALAINTFLIINKACWCLYCRWRAKKEQAERVEEERKHIYQMLDFLMKLSPEDAASRIIVVLNSSLTPQEIMAYIASKKDKEWFDRFSAAM